MTLCGRAGGMICSTYLFDQLAAMRKVSLDAAAQAINKYLLYITFCLPSVQQVSASHGVGVQEGGTCHVSPLICT